MEAGLRHFSERSCDMSLDYETLKKRLFAFCNAFYAFSPANTISL